MKKYIIILFSGIALINFSCELEKFEKKISPKGAYLGQQEPGNVPTLFYDQLFGQGHNEFGLIFSNDGKELIYSRLLGINATFTLINMKMNDDSTWSDPEVMPFSGTYIDGNPHLADSDKRLYFSSKRPLYKGGVEQYTLDIWYVDRTKDGWSEPVNPGPPLNYPHTYEDYACVYNNKMYFESDRDDPITYDRDLYCADIVDGKFTNVQNLGDSINDPHFYDANVSISNEGIMFFTSERSGIQDIYYSKQDSNGHWRKALKLPSPINTDFMEGQPRVTHDNKYFFFSRRIRYERHTYWVSLDYIKGLMEY